MNTELALYLPRYEKMRDTMSNEEHMKNRALEQNSIAGFGQCSKITPNTKFNQYLRPSDGLRRSEHGYQ